MGVDGQKRGIVCHQKSLDCCCFLLATAIRKEVLEEEEKAIRTSQNNTNSKA